MFCIRHALVWTLVAVSGAAQVRIPIQKQVFANGLTVYLVERHQAPVFTARIAFKAGSVDEVTGRTGVAHVLEHMLFKGTRSIGLKDPADAVKEDGLLLKEDGLWEAILAEQRTLDQGSRTSVLLTGKPGPESSPRLEALRKDFEATQAEHRQLLVSNAIGALYDGAGAVGVNAGTSFDQTIYDISLPKNRFELWCRVEADRMNAPVLREFYSEREVIKEERRMRFDDGNPEPTWVPMETFLGTAFLTHPYGRPLVGSMSDLFNLKRAEVQAFYTQYYAPNRAALVLVGDLTWKEITPALEAYFGKLKRQPEPPPVHTVEAEQKGERRSVVEKDMTPMVYIGWHIPGMGHPDEPALEVLASVLSEGRSSRLYRKAIEGAQLATRLDCSTGFPGSKYPNLFLTIGVVKGEHTTAELEQALYDEVAILQREPIAQTELDRVLTKAAMDTLSGMEDNASLAETMALHWAKGGDEASFRMRLERLKAVTPADLQRVARTYCTARNRVVTTLVRVAGPKDPVDAELEALLIKAIAPQVKDPAEAKAALEKELGKLKRLPPEQKQSALQQLREAYGK